MENNLERLQKVMASSGVASRRKCEELILAGKVKVNGVVANVLGTKVGKKDRIEVEGKVLVKEDLVYYVLYKPTGYVTTVNDEHNRRIVFDLLNKNDKQKRLFPIGRLDYDTSGVLLLTNDGDLSYKLTNSKKEIEKQYLVRVDGILTLPDVKKLTLGVIIDGKKTKRAKVSIESVDRKNNSCLVSITITEGRNHQVRNMFEAIGYPVKKLKRISFGGINLEGLSVGEYRPLKIHEIKTLHNL